MSPGTPPPIGLESLSIRDFRGIGLLDLDFRRVDGQPSNLVVLAGPNGCGKTTVLEAALIAVGGHRLAAGTSGKRAVRQGAARYEIKASLPARGQLLDDDRMLVATSDFSPIPDRLLPFWYFSSWRAPTLVGAVNVTVGKPGRRPAKTDPNRLLNVKQQLTNAAAARSFPGSKLALVQTYSELINRVNEAWSTFYPGRGDEFFVGLIDPEEAGAGAFEVYYRRPGELPLAVDYLSAGQLELFLFLAALILNEDREGIVFIDEPELHLDPQWHTPIVRALMRLQPKAQFIMATHSLTVYDAAMSYERHFLVSEDDPRAAIWRRAVAPA